eukprot:gnl/Spiro4/23496_TR11612_c0_g1_i1.p1 gnl/Spiro4/23496_TR11612_c0_g1~~gnl/Spiro4/23496_TR11612_c0_g1_i1.p1  ORF type:complete len:147 (-),score=45.81 gnl/Spiro4/23496_TR11612_c0_g1_i1:511-924(-)
MALWSLFVVLCAVFVATTHAYTGQFRPFLSNPELVPSSSLVHDLAGKATAKQRLNTCCGNMKVIPYAMYNDTRCSYQPAVRELVVSGCTTEQHVGDSSVDSFGGVLCYADRVVYTINPNRLEAQAFGLCGVGVVSHR